MKQFKSVLVAACLAVAAPAVFGVGDDVLDQAVGAATAGQVRQEVKDATGDQRPLNEKAVNAVRRAVE